MAFFFDHCFTEGKDISVCKVVVNFSQPQTTKGPSVRMQKFLREYGEGPPAEPYPRKMPQSLQSLLGERSPAGGLSVLFRYWPCLEVGVGADP